MPRDILEARWRSTSCWRSLSVLSASFSGRLGVLEPDEIRCAEDGILTEDAAGAEGSPKGVFGLPSTLLLYTPSQSLVVFVAK